MIFNIHSLAGSTGGRSTPISMLGASEGCNEPYFLRACMGTFNIHSRSDYFGHIPISPPECRPRGSIVPIFTTPAIILGSSLAGFASIPIKPGVRIEGFKSLFTHAITPGGEH